MQLEDDFKNLKILLIDDNSSIHGDFRKILVPDNQATGLRDAEEIFFGETADESIGLAFELDSAYQGEEGYQKVCHSLEIGSPYAMAFVDMRMPPGWDGLKTIEKLWEADPNLQVVICSAYSDHSWPDICKRIGQTDRLLILKKPFDNAEVSQLALAVTKKWNLTQKARLTTEQLQELVEKQTLQIKEKDRELRHKQKLEAVGSLAGGVAHEFNNLLQVIHGLTTLVIQDLPDDDPSLENLGGVVDAANRATGITKHLLSFCRRHPTQKLDFEVNEIVTATIKMVNPLLGEEVEIQANLNENSGNVMADGDQISQALLNMCVNARDAMPDGGVIRIATERVNVQEGRESGQLPLDIPSGEYSLISISDSGVGISNDFLDRIFEPFFTTKDVGKGTGMGLAMVFGAVQEHGGGIAVESELGKGTTFRVFLPVSQPEELTMPTKSPDGKSEDTLLSAAEPSHDDKQRFQNVTV